MTTAPPLPPGFLRRPFAHRGLHQMGRPENSLAAAEAAAAEGYGIEIDLQPSSDGVAMVFHDDTLKRMTGAEGLIADQSASDLAGMALSGSAERVPRLGDLLDVVAARVPILIELKDQSGTLGPAEPILETVTAEVLATYSGAVAVMSFNPEMIQNMAELLPGVPRGLVTCDFLPEDWPSVPAKRARELARIADADRVGAVFVSHDHRALSMRAVAEQKAAGRAVLCWTISNPAEETAAYRFADAVTFEGYSAGLRPGLTGPDTAPPDDP